MAINDCNGDDALSSDCEQISLIEQPKRAIRVLLADDDTLVLAALADLLSDDPRIEIIGTVGNAGAAVEMARAERPDVAVFDLMMPGGGVQATLELGRLCPRTQVIGYSWFDDSSHESAMLEAGAASYLVKGAPSADVLTAILNVFARGR